ncbi:CLUMA_CG015673, isoform A [Clunio marinus]|uniref:CLUMA_CG015673, isoform A n=1 Tax=Clunio marinus TaxID=568069 RepID=A0A1J1IQI1_9DIPT|nr:CLUMA_CG015673, isoform A [Clunio marinus]
MRSTSTITAGEFHSCSDGRKENEISFRIRSLKEEQQQSRNDDDEEEEETNLNHPQIHQRQPTSRKYIKAR